MDFAQKNPYSEIRFDRFLEFSVNFNDVCFYVHVGSILQDAYDNEIKKNVLIIFLVVFLPKIKQMVKILYSHKKVITNAQITHAFGNNTGQIHFFSV